MKGGIEGNNQARLRRKVEGGRGKRKKWYIPRGTQSPNTETQKEVEEGDLLFFVVHVVPD